VKFKKDKTEMMILEWCLCVLLGAVPVLGVAESVDAGVLLKSLTCRLKGGVRQRTS